MITSYLEEMKKKSGKKGRVWNLMCRLCYLYVGEIMQKFYQILLIVNKWRQISHTNSQILRVQTILCCLLRWNLCHHWIGLSAAFTPRSKKWFIYFGKSTQLIGQTLKWLFLNNCNYNFLNYCYHDNHFIFFTL